jgi:ornithine carbamoyltransferase
VVVSPALADGLAGRSLLRITDLTPDEAELVLELSSQLRGERSTRLAGRTLGLIFMQQSTRTRLSFSAGMAQLGGQPISFRGDELQLSRGESIGDTARVLSRYLDAVAIRTLSHGDLEEWAEAASIPVINALTSAAHPCQALADVLTIRDRLGGLAGVRIGWVGDGTNVLVSLAELAHLTGMSVVAACPEGYDPPEGTPLHLVRDPRAAADGADVLVTDIWVSLGQEAERERRLRDLEPYRLDAGLLGIAGPDAIVLHCLPAHPGEEIAADVLYGPQSVVWDEAENRLHVQKALLVLLLGAVQPPVSRRRLRRVSPRARSRPRAPRRRGSRPGRRREVRTRARAAACRRGSSPRPPC